MSSGAHKLCQWPRGCDRQARTRFADWLLCLSHDRYARKAGSERLLELERSIASSAGTDRVTPGIAERWINAVATLPESYGGECDGEALL